NLPGHAILDFGASKLAPRFIGPFKLLERHDNAYTLDIQFSMRLHQTLCVGRLKHYRQHESSSGDDLTGTTKQRESASREQRRGRTASPASTQVRLGCRKRSERPLRPALLRRAASVAKRQAPRSGIVLERQHDQAESESHGQPGVDHTRNIFPPPPPPLRDARGSTRCIVERRVGYEAPKTNRDQARLRIRWRGFPPHRDTWEPLNVLMEDVPEMVRAYEAQNRVQA
ncbi:hypothetical protein F442_02456, partial [Phytophthora nicotianae P10297]